MAQGGDTVTLWGASKRFTEDLDLEFEAAKRTWEQHDGAQDPIAATWDEQLRALYASDPVKLRVHLAQSAEYWHHDREEVRVWTCLGNGVAEFREWLLDVAYRTGRGFASLSAALGRLKARESETPTAVTVGA